MSLKNELDLLNAELADARAADVQAIADKLSEISFSCQRCAGCCTAPDGGNIVAMFPGEVRAIMAATGKSWFEVAQPPDSDDFDSTGNRHTFEWVLRRDADEICVFLEGNRCSIYEVRPIICRTYPFRLEAGRLEQYECDGPGACGSARVDQFRLASALVSRRVRELEETIDLLRRFEPYEPGKSGEGGHIVVHDSEGTRHVCRASDGQYHFYSPGGVKS
jgi:Fe-S-cluster containining protein